MLTVGFLATAYLLQPTDLWQVIALCAAWGVVDFYVARKKSHDPK